MSGVSHEHRELIGADNDELVLKSNNFPQNMDSDNIKSFRFTSRSYPTTVRVIFSDYKPRPDGVLKVFWQSFLYEQTHCVCMKRVQ